MINQLCWRFCILFKSSAGIISTSKTCLPFRFWLLTEFQFEKFEMCESLKIGPEVRLDPASSTKLPHICSSRPQLLTSTASSPSASPPPPSPLSLWSPLGPILPFAFSHRCNRRPKTPLPSPWWRRLAPLEKCSQPVDDPSSTSASDSHCIGHISNKILIIERKVRIKKQSDAKNTNFCSKLLRQMIFLLYTGTSALII